MIAASENRSLERALELLPATRRHARSVLARLDAVHPLPRDARVLDVGAAQGLFVVASLELGYDAVGVEPWAPARDVATSIAARLGRRVALLDGVAEALPVADESCDVVHAMSVIEHVENLEAAFAEAFRVLRPGGVFWFSASSSMCPIQNEIRGFPAFGWYPNALKIAIMTWALENHPKLIGHTTRPAYHWFTPWKARRLLRSAGFTTVRDRWDLRLPREGGRSYRAALAVIQSSSLTKAIADLFVPTCSYAAFK